MFKKYALVITTLAAVGGGSAWALPATQFSQKEFSELAAGHQIAVVGFHSDSCGSCKVQKPNLEALLKEQEFSKVHGLLANFEATEEFRQSLKRPVRGPSTIVIFKGGEEVARIQGVTEKAKLRDLILKAI